VFSIIILLEKFIIVHTTLQIKKIHFTYNITTNVQWAVLSLKSDLLRQPLDGDTHI
jgi:hypothetical protein